MGIVGDNGASVKVSFSTQIKNIVFVWKSLPKTGADSEHFEPNTTYLEREGCTPEFILYSWILGISSLAAYLRTISNSERKWVFTQETVLVLFFFSPTLTHHPRDGKGWQRKEKEHK